MLEHVRWLVRLRLLRFRLETFGIYYPSLPHERAWWQIAPRPLMLMIRRMPPFARWAGDVQAVARSGAPGWWRRHLSPSERSRWQRSLAELNR